MGKIGARSTILRDSKALREPLDLWHGRALYVLSNGVSGIPWNNNKQNCSGGTGRELGWSSYHLHISVLEHQVTQGTGRYQVVETLFSHMQIGQYHEKMVVVALGLAHQRDDRMPG